MRSQPLTTMRLQTVMVLQYGYSAVPASLQIRHLCFPMKYGGMNFAIFHYLQMAVPKCHCEGLLDWCDETLHMSTSHVILFLLACALPGCCEHTGVAVFPMRSATHPEVCFAQRCPPVPVTACIADMTASLLVLSAFSWTWPLPQRQTKFPMLRATLKGRIARLFALKFRTGDGLFAS